MPERTEAGKSSWTSLACEVLFWPARILALLVVATCPWYYGSVSWYCQSLYVPIVLVIFLLAITGAALRKVRFGNPLVWSLAALLALVLLQTMPLPDWLWKTVSAGAAFEKQVDGMVAQLTAAVRDNPSQAGDSQPPSDIPAEPRTLSINWVQTRASSATFAMALAWLIATIILFRTAGWEIVLISRVSNHGFSGRIFGSTANSCVEQMDLVANAHGDALCHLCIPKFRASVFGSWPRLSARNTGLVEQFKKR